MAKILHNRPVLNVLQITFPFFALVLCGYIAARKGILPHAAIPGLNSFVLFFALPCMLFRFGASTPIAQLLDASVFGIYLFCALVMVAFSIAVTKNTRIGWNDASLGASKHRLHGSPSLGRPFGRKSRRTRNHHHRDRHGHHQLALYRLVAIGRRGRTRLQQSRKNRAQRHAVQSHAVVDFAGYISLRHQFDAAQTRGRHPGFVGRRGLTCRTFYHWRGAGTLADEFPRATRANLVDRLRPRSRHQAIRSPHLGFAGCLVRQTARRTYRHLHLNSVGTDSHLTQRQQCLTPSRTLRREQWPHRADYFDIDSVGVFDIFGGCGAFAALIFVNKQNTIRHGRSRRIYCLNSYKKYSKLNRFGCPLLAIYFTNWMI
jgi:Membrane transport protein